VRPHQLGCVVVTPQGGSKHAGAVAVQHVEEGLGEEVAQIGALRQGQPRGQLGWAPGGMGWAEKRRDQRKRVSANGWDKRGVGRVQLLWSVCQSQSLLLHHILLLLVCCTSGKNPFCTHTRPAATPTCVPAPGAPP
jgi:hypothetical protein